MGGSEGRPLPALLSQALVAFTVELDGEHERRTTAAGARARLSLVVWSDLVQWLEGGTATVSELATRSRSSMQQVKTMVGCLERWGDAEFPELGAQRRARGSGRGLRGDTRVQLTECGSIAAREWPACLAEVEQRWGARFGADVAGLRDSLAAIVDRVEASLPLGVPLDFEALGPSPRAAADASAATLPLPALLSQALVAFALEYDAGARAPLRLASNVIRVLGDGPAPVAELPARTGLSSEACAVGWQLRPFVELEATPGRRGRSARLTARGEAVAAAHPRRVAQIEARWTERFGDPVTAAHAALTHVFEARDGDRPRLSAGLAPPAGTVRTGVEAPSLRRAALTPVARRRLREIVAQTEAFVRDPGGSLPHYPVWDANRGFGP